MNAGPTIRSAPVGARLAIMRARSGVVMDSAAKLPEAMAAVGLAPDLPAARAPVAAPPSPAPAVAPAPAAPATTVGAVEHSARVVEMCGAAGFMDLAVVALKQGLDFPSVKAKIEVAQEIQMIAKSVHLPGMAAHLIRSDVSVETARELLFTAKANADAAIITDTTPPPARTAGQLPKVEAARVYARLNAPRRTRRAGAGA